MGIIIKQYHFKHIPYLMVVDDAKINDILPTIFIYHGWTNSKDEQLIDAYEIAKQGFRAVVPDVCGHGERHETIAEKDFFDIVIQTVKELKDLADNLIEQGLVDQHRIAVTGMSMGGIITCAALAQYPWIKTAAVLMGSPTLVTFLDYLVDKANEEQLATLPDNILPQLQQQLKMYDLSQHLNMIHHKPIFFWHDRIDRVVPYKLTANFIKNVEHETNITFVKTAGRGHRVKHDIKLLVAQFFLEHL